MHHVVHTEFNSKNPKQTAEFFTKIFGWKTKDGSADSEGGMEYIIWSYGDGDENSMGEGGGIYTLPEHTEGITTLVYIQVENITQTLTKANELGATTKLEETAIGPHGFIAMMVEPGGCPIGLWAKNASK